MGPVRFLALAILCILATIAASSSLLALDESTLTPTGAEIVLAEEQEFQDAMTIWKGHHYAEGQRLLRDFSTKRPKSRWAAEADLHVGCYLTYTKRYDEARKVFKDILAKHPKGSIAIKARIRLGNVAEQTGKLKEAVRYYGEVLQMAPTWDQFRYANFRARTLIPKLHRWQAMINCGPTALASCLEALGKAQESAQARSRLRHIL